MLLCYGHVQPTYTIAGGALLTDPVAFSDRRPARAARVAWPSGSQSPTTTCSIRAAMRPVTARGVALLNTTLPAGLKVELRGRRAADAGYTYPLGGEALAQRLTRRLDGGTGAVWVLPASGDPIVGLEVRLYNDIGNAVALTAGEAFDVGEIVIGGGVDFVIQSDWTIDGKDPSTVARTSGSQATRVARPSYRVLECTPTDDEDAGALGGGLSDGSDWQTLGAALRADPYVLAIARTGSADLVQTTSIYGIATRVPGISHRVGPIYQPAQLVIEEIPG